MVRSFLWTAPSCEIESQQGMTYELRSAGLTRSHVGPVKLQVIRPSAYVLLAIEPEIISFGSFGEGLPAVLVLDEVCVFYTSSHKIQ